MRLTRIKAVTYAALLALTIPFAATAAAHEDAPASGGSTPEIHDGLFPAEPLEDLEDDMLSSLASENGSGIPDDVLTLTEKISARWGGDIVNSVNYDRATDTVDVLMSPYADRADIGDIQALDKRVTIRRAKHSRQEFVAIAHELSGTRVGDATVWGAGPAPDHDGLIVYAEPDKDARARGSWALEDYETTIRGFKATVRFGARPIAAVGAPR
ncbi:hypothetical protein EHW97_01400 [Aeromicrobium camelliae]|uniref:Uncharacterized protein n=1 Tax=Aeromicrobium camelliae TaxID=1538144 RepID=A0A3N6ZJ31_9ACTN|nr:hypothetical protein [Aeromicrobium camelliae]RQN10171.1 hypothetical protein EHW97_01400 [Aeromicrobium camelliae]